MPALVMRFHPLQARLIVSGICRGDSSMMLTEFHGAWHSTNTLAFPALVIFYFWFFFRGDLEWSKNTEVIVSLEKAGWLWGRVWCFFQHSRAVWCAAFDQQGNSVILVDVCKLRKNRLFFFLKEFKRKSSTLVNNAAPRGYGLANESLSAKHGLPPHNVSRRPRSYLKQRRLLPLLLAAHQI